MLKFNVLIGRKIQLRIKTVDSPQFAWKLITVLAMRSDFQAIQCQYDGEKFWIPAGSQAALKFCGHTVQVGFVKKHGPSVAEMIVSAPKCIGIQRDGFIGSLREGSAR
jgi:hypothetical protein